jgi:hypothetical protein
MLKLSLLFVMSLVMGSFADKLKVVVPTDVYRDYVKFVGSKNPVTIENFTGEHSRRDVVELILLQKALALGGVLEPISFIQADSYARIQAQVKSGAVLMAANTLWQTDITPMSSDVYTSEPLIAKGEFEAGFYTTPENKKALAVKTVEELKNLSVISNKAWTVDWETLSGVGFKKLINSVTWNSMVRMVKGKRGDVLLSPFQYSPDFSFVASGQKFVPIKGLKIGLMGSRHLIVSKKNKEGERVFKALNKGVKELRKKGILKKAYEGSGFFNTRVSDWKKVN